jgi:cytochrome P450
MATIATEISSNTLFTILFLLPLIYLIAKQLKALYSSRFAPLPPGPYSWPILGNALQIGNSPHITLASLAKTYGPLFSLRLGSQLVIVAASQEAATEILKTQDRFLSGRFVPDVIPAKWLKLENLSLGWIGEVNNEFKFLRTVCQSKLFSNKALLSQSCLREKKAADTVRFIRTMEGKVLKIKKVAFAAVFSMLTNILISSDLISMEQESMEGEMTEIIRNIFEVGAAPNISDLFPILAPFDLQNLRKKSKELYLRFSTMFEAIIEERRERKMSSDNASGKEDFLDTLISNGSSNEHINVLLLV